MKHAVAPLLEGVSNLSGARVPALCSGMSLYFRDVYDHLQRLNQTAESIRDTVATAISVNLSMVTLQENETMKRLAAYAALLAGSNPSPARAAPSQHHGGGVIPDRAYQYSGNRSQDPSMAQGIHGRGHAEIGQAA
jgi:CorA-like Mg2+ transporter protein